MSASKKGGRKALGRGLGALIPDSTPPARRKRSAFDAGEPKSESSGLKQVPIERLRPGDSQPRKHFDDTALDELAASIKTYGILQPVVVSAIASHPGHYEILAGERRWRAAQRAGVQDIPVVVRASESSERLELALIENIQRADLSPMEEARAFQAIIDLNGYTQVELAERVGKDRSSVANLIRLLRLPVKVQDLVQLGKLGMGHARALLAFDNPADISALAAEAVRRGMSVRKVEAEVRRQIREAQAELDPKEEDDDAKRHAIIVADLEKRIGLSLGAPVRLKTGRKKGGPGKVEINYKDLDDLNRILHVLLGTEPL